MQVIGSASGAFGLAERLSSGHSAAVELLSDAGISYAGAPAANANSLDYSITAFWQVPDCKGKAWVDLLNDVTSKDIAQSVREGFKAVEHLKRYTINRYLHRT